jgi:CHASE3 domain sensor protein
VVSFAFLGSATRELRSAGVAAHHSDEVIWAAHALENDVVETQASTRGFVITGKESFLLPFHAAEREVQANHRRLEALVHDNPLQRGRAAEMSVLIDAHMHGWARPLVRLARTDRARAMARISTGRGDREIRRIRGRFRAFVAAERRLAKERTEREAAAQS